MKTKRFIPRRALAGVCLTALLATAEAAPSAGPGSVIPIGFRTDPGPGGQSARTPGRSRPSLQSPDSAPADAQGQPAFLRIVLPKKDLVVGERVPVEIKAYFREGVSASLNGLPILSSDAFALNKLSDKPEQTQETIDGVVYTVAAWSTALSGVKAGDYPLKIDLPVMLRARERGKRRERGHDPFQDFFGDDSPFNNSFFDDFFAQTTEKPLTLHSDGAVVKIKALPASGRPADFSGAVGEFNVASEASASSGTTGDPLTLKVSITGSGNFDRVFTSGLPASADWKTYKPGAPSTKGAAADPSEDEGTKTFEQSIVPMNAGAQKIPAIRFSYFDPSTGNYVTKTTAPIAINVALGAAAPAVATAPAPPASARNADAGGLAPDEVLPASATASLRPLALAPWFIVFNAFLLVALAIGAIWNRISRRRSNDPRKLQRESSGKAVSEALDAMDAALKAQDAPRFFTAARRALQDRLAEQWDLPASRVTIPEIRSRLNGRAEGLRSLFQTADEIAYSGRRFTIPDLQQWRELVHQQLACIERL